MKNAFAVVVCVLLLSAGLGCGPKEAPAPVEPVAPPVPEPEPEPEPAAEVEPLEFTPDFLTDAEAKLLDEEGAGRLYEVGDWLVCVMEGTHDEMGFQHGRLLAKKIEHVCKEGYMQRTLYGKGYTQEYVYEQSARMAAHFPAGCLEEIRGIVRGIEAAGIEGIGYEDILTAACVAELQHHGPDDPPGCSNFAVFGRWTPDGRLLHGRNLDWSIGGGAQDDAVILVWRPTGGIPFMMPSWAGLIGGVSGMNARQITIGEMTVSSPAETFDGMPLNVIMRHILEVSSTLDEAVEVMKTSRRTLGWNFVIGDGKIPDARALEVDRDTVEVFAPEDPRESEETGHWALPDAVRRTNHPCGEVLQQKIVAAHGADYGINADDWESAKPLAKAFLEGQNTWHRYDWLGRQIAARPGRVDIAVAAQLLSNGPVAAGNTLHSWVFDPRDATAYIANARSEPEVPAWKTRYTRIDLSGWFK